MQRRFWLRLKPLKVLGGLAEKAPGLGLIAEQKRQLVALTGGEAAEAGGEHEVPARLEGSDFVHVDFPGDGALPAVEMDGGFFKKTEPVAGFHSVDTFDAELGEGDLAREELFGGGFDAIAGGEFERAGAQFLDVLDVKGGELLGGEGVLHGVVSGAGLAFRGSWPGGLLRVGAVGGEAGLARRFRGGGMFARLRHEVLLGRGVTREERDFGPGRVEMVGIKGERKVGDGVTGVDARGELRSKRRRARGR